MTGRLEFFKGHGTGNDFVLLPDADDRIRVDPQAVRAVCDRRFGVGADGLIRVVPEAPGGRWFMDYYNADGSAGQMCGNGARVFARFLRDEGFVDGDDFVIQTRGGARGVHIDADTISVDMGPARVVPAAVTVRVDGREWPGAAVFMPNPHAVAFVDDLAHAGALQSAPLVDSEVFTDGVNVEFVVEHEPGRHVAMRVHERGVGETLSCGTGVCAVADRALARAGVAGPARIRVDVPGGTLFVERTPGASLVLSGPALLVARGELSDGMSEMFGG
jgi:diaminopimelate epimerase